MSRPHLRDEVIAEVAARYPDLRFEVNEGRAYLRGTYPVSDDQGPLDRYAIEMEFPPEFPDELPIVREVAGRIPPTADRHMNPVDGTTCVLVPEEWFLCHEDRSFGAYMAGPLRNYFLGQALVERGQPWPFGERSHGIEGIREAYADILGIADLSRVDSYLESLTHSWIKGHWSCPCGSGEPLRRCHLAQVRAMQARVSPSVASGMRARLNPVT